MTKFSTGRDKAEKEIKLSLLIWQHEQICNDHQCFVVKFYLNLSIKIIHLNKSILHFSHFLDLDFFVVFLSGIVDGKLWKQLFISFGLSGHFALFYVG